MSHDLHQGLALAFAVTYAQQIIHADRVEDYDAFALFGGVFPRALLQQHGYLDTFHRFTPELERARHEAEQVLPAAWSDAAKLDLLSLLWGTGVPDGCIDGREADVIRDAADRLGVPFASLLHRVQVLAA